MSKSKRKGTAWERQVVDYLGFNLEQPAVERRALEGILDRGDVAGIVDWTVECKDHNTSLWGPWMDETEKERQNAGTTFGLLVVKRRLHNVAKAFAVLPLDQMVELILDHAEVTDHIGG
jgi:hypothetical protein